MLNSLSIKVLFDRKKKATKPRDPNPQDALIQLSVNLNTERRYISTRVRVYDGQFMAGQVCNRPDAIELNKRINSYVTQICELVNTCDRENKMCTHKMIDELFFWRKPPKEEFMGWLNETIEKRKDLAIGTVKHHRTTADYLRTMGVTEWADINIDTIRRIDKDLRNKNMRQTSIHNYHKIFKSYINIAIREGLLQDNPYKMFVVSRGKPRQREVLTMEELQRIMRYHPTTPYLQHVRDLFLMQCFTGLSHVDLVNTDFRQLADKNIITGRRHKTGEEYATVLLEPAREILKRYNYKLPEMSYDNYRRMIQPMLTANGIEKKMSTHNGRHTFATTVTLSNGVPMEIVQKMMGHADIKTTQIYAKVQESMVQGTVDGLNKVF